MVQLTQPWSSTGRSSRRYFDASGRLWFSRDAYRNYAQVLHDPLGRDTALVRFAGAPGSFPSVSYTRSFDLRGRVQQDSDDSSGTRSYTYLPTGELSAIAQAANRQYGSSPSGVQFKIGALGRVVQRDLYRLVRDAATCAWKQEVKSDHYQYDTPYNSGDYGATAGHLTAEWNSDATIAYGYTAQGWLARRDEWLSGTGTGVHSWVNTFANDGRLLSRTVNSSYLATPVAFYSRYDSSGHLVKVDDGNANPYTYWQAVGTADTGVFDALDRAPTSNADNGLISNQLTISPYSSLPTGTRALLNPGASQTVLFDATHTYAGLQASATTVKSAVDPSGGTSYLAAYDQDGRLSQMSAAGLAPYSSSYSHFISSSANAAASTQASLWNLQSSQMTIGSQPQVAQTYSYAGGGEQLSKITTAGAATPDLYAHDSRGRGLLTTHSTGANQSPPQHRFDYDAIGRLVGISKQGTAVETLAYDPAGGLASRSFAAGSPDGARFYPGSELSLVQRAAESAAYVHLEINGLRIASVWQKKANGSSSASSSGVLYYHRDRLGSVVATSTLNGGYGVSYRYFPYGGISFLDGTESDATASELGFTGGLKLSEGIIHLGARDYWTATGRFLQPDDLDARRYTYAGGDPLNRVDPSGMEDEELGVIAPFPSSGGGVSFSFGISFGSDIGGGSGWPSWRSTGAVVSGGLYGAAQAVVLCHYCADAAHAASRW